MTQPHQKFIVTCEECGEDFDHFARHRNCKAKRFCDRCTVRRGKKRYKDNVRKRNENQTVTNSVS